MWFLPPLKVISPFYLSQPKRQKFGFLPEAKTEEWDQKLWNVFDQFGMTIPCSATYFLEVGAHVSLKVATKVSLEGKKLWKFKFLGCFFQSKNGGLQLKRLKCFWLI